MPRIVHIIGAGLAGLSAAVRLATPGNRVIVHEATAFAGGRCRSYHDAFVGMTIDNGNHLLLSGNFAALDFLRKIGSEHRLVGPPAAEFPFLDLKSRARWTLRFDDGRLPFWIFDSKRRVPGTRALDYLSMARLLWGSPVKTVGETIACKGTLYSGLIEPLLLAALNIDPPQGSAKLAAAVIRETLAAGGRACRPLIARDGLAPTLIEPALNHLRGRGAEIRLERQLRAMRFAAQHVETLDFGDETVTLGDADAVILAVPPYAAVSLVAGLTVPNEFRAIVNAHFRVEPPAGQPPILGVINGTTQWIFAFPSRLSSAQQQHRHFDAMLHAAGSCSQKDIGEESMPMGAHCHEVATFLFHPFYYLSHRIAIGQLRNGADFGRFKFAPDFFQVSCVLRNFGTDSVRTVRAGGPTIGDVQQNNPRVR